MLNRLVRFGSRALQVGGRFFVGTAVVVNSFVSNRIVGYDASTCRNACIPREELHIPA
jgi:hypothetical protein